MNQKTTIAAIVLATILAASTVMMALPFESAEASREGGDATGGEGGDARSRGGDAEIEAEGGDARQGDFEAEDGGNIEGNDAFGGNAGGNEATGGAGGAATGGAGGEATGGAGGEEVTTGPDAVE